MDNQGAGELAAESSLLSEMFSQIPVASFLATSFLKAPCASAGTCFGARPLGSPGKLLELLRHPQADILIGRGGSRREGALPQTADDITAILAEGFTIGLRHVHAIDKELWTCAQQFQIGFAAAVDIHLYCTPANQPGFGWHYDAEEVFVLQTRGEKEWRLRKNTVNPWPLIETIPANQRYEREIMPMMSCRLCEGDWLYIPAGYWHQTQAHAESISLSIGLRPLTALDVYDSLRPQLLNDLLWRQRLPCLGSFAGGSKAFQNDWPALREMLKNDLQQRLEQMSVESLELLMNRMAQATGTGP